MPNFYFPPPPISQLLTPIFEPTAPGDPRPHIDFAKANAESGKQTEKESESRGAEERTYFSPFVECAPALRNHNHRAGFALWFVNRLLISHRPNSGLLPVRAKDDCEKVRNRKNENCAGQDSQRQTRLHSVLAR